MAAINPTAARGENAGPIPVPMFAAYDPKDRTDPLHLHPNESPSLQLVTILLEGRSNYHPWARAMEMALKSKNKLVLVDGSLAIPSKADPRFFYWDQCNTMVLSWIGFCVLILPQYQHLRVFGCLAFAVIPSCQRNKLSPRARKCTFLGFANGVKGYKLYDMQTKEVFLSRDVCFYEDSFPFQNNPTKHTAEFNLETDLVLPSGEVHYSDTDGQMQEATISSSSHHQTQEDTYEQTHPVPAVQIRENITEPDPQPRRSTRVRTTPTYLSDYNCHNAAVKMTSPHLISNVLSYNSLSQKYKAFDVNALVAKEPKTYNDAIKQECWRKAMEDEINALQANNTLLLLEGERKVRLLKPIVDHTPIVNREECRHPVLRCLLISPDPVASSELLLLSPSHWNGEENAVQSFRCCRRLADGRGWRGVDSVKALRRLRTPLLCFVAPLPEERGSEKLGKLMGSQGVAGFSSSSSKRASTLKIIVAVTTPSFARSMREELATPHRARRRALPRRVTSFFTPAGGGDGELGSIVGSLPLHDVAITTEALWP
nr:Retrovirus-related Pol polyprotein from transposon TNT 1-94 [Ipomoea batatas]